MADFEKRASYFAIRQTQLIPREEMLETGRKQRSLTIGIPKESDPSENRIALTPQGVELLTENGHKILIEKEAGKAANYTDNDFSEAGAIILQSKSDVYNSDVVLKISPPPLREIEMLTPNQLLMSFLYMPRQTRESLTSILETKVNAIAYEFLKDEVGCYPVIRSMSEIEGYAAITIASEYLSKARGGKGVLLGGITGVTPAEVVIIGAGTAGEFAARAALGFGCQVKVFDNSYKNLKELERNVGQRLFTSVLHPSVLSKALKSADAVVASLRYFDDNTDFYITKEQVEIMKPGSVIVDLSVGNGGCFESSESPNPNNPVITDNGVVSYFVPNVASRVSRTASIALSNIFAPVILRLAQSGNIHNLIKEDNGVSNGTYIYKGILTNSHIGKYLNIPYKDIGLLMAAF